MINEITTFDSVKVTKVHPTAMVKEFYDTFGQRPSNELCVNLIREEVKEVAEAAEHLLKELCDLCYVLEGATLHGVDIAKEDSQTALNVLSLFGNYAPTFNEVFPEAFYRVHQSNMSKFVGGKPLIREDGKLLKGPNYKLPSLIDLI